jgi:hypothetical protein
LGAIDAEPADGDAMEELERELLGLELDKEMSSCGKPVGGRVPPCTEMMCTEVDVDEPDEALRVEAEVDELSTVDKGPTGFTTGISET